jgi:anti-anti-sigma regulatory factor
MAATVSRHGGRQGFGFDHRPSAGHALPMVNPADARAFACSSIGSELRIVVRKEFDFGVLSQDWAHTITIGWPGPYRRVVMDMGQVGLVSSTFFAGLIKLQQFYGPMGSGPLVLEKPDPRVVRNLQILRLETLFDIHPRPT